MAVGPPRFYGRDWCFDTGLTEMQFIEIKNELGGGRDMMGLNQEMEVTSITASY